MDLNPELIIGIIKAYINTGSYLRNDFIRTQGPDCQIVTLLNYLPVEAVRKRSLLFQRLTKKGGARNDKQAILAKA